MALISMRKEAITATRSRAASRAGHNKIVKLLLSKGTSIAEQRGFSGDVLLASSGEGHDKAVKLLLSNDADSC
jgi:hypothetical protein